MGFVPISIEQFLKIHMKKNPNENEKEILLNLNSALEKYKNGIKCSCGNDIWVIASAFVGNTCFSCITGEKDPSDDFEIEEAVFKNQNIKGRRHIDSMKPHEINGIFDDQGYEVNVDLIKKPSLCLVCANNDDSINNNPYQEVLCNLTRFGQQYNDEFMCSNFIKNYDK